MVADVTQAAPAGKPGSPVSAGQVIQVRLLGQFAVTAGERTAGPWPRPSARRLCALLLVSPGHRVSRDLACAELFQNLEPRAAARSLSKALSMARTALAELGEPGSALLGGDLTHLWLAPGLAVDADGLTAALRAGLAMPAGQDRDDALTAALADDAELLPDEPYATWADQARDRLNALRQEARLTLARDRGSGIGSSGPEAVIAAWLAYLRYDWASEEAAGAVIRLYVGQGRPEQAARVFERCRAALEQLGLRVSPSLERIYASAVARALPEPGTAPASPAQVPPASLPSAFGPAPVPPSAAPPTVTAGAPRSWPAGPLREERRPVTMLFAEVAAPADLAARFGLEWLRDYVGGSLAAVIAEVEALGGTVTSVSGRGLQAMFGAPEAHEDDPERAMRAAYRALCAAYPALAAPTANGPQASAGAGAGTSAVDAVVRIGIESGPALVGPLGDGAKAEYLALGDVVAAAAALQAAARPGSVLVGHATRAVTEHLFRWGAREEVPLASGAGPLIATYLDAPRARAAERRPRLGGAPLIGRQAELRLLDTALRAAVEGRGQSVLLTGEPGIGKTRLAREARNRFIGWVGAGGGRRPLWLEGRGASYASAVPYGLYRYLLASWLGVALDQPAAALRSALSDALTGLMGNANLFAPLAYLMGLPEQERELAPGPDRDKAGKAAPEELRRRVFSAVRALVSRFAAIAPTVLVLEDLHWADPTSLSLTADLAELTEGRPLLLLATSRPGEGPVGMAAALNAREIRLRPLGDGAAEALTRSLIGQADASAVLSAANADGNPLFIEERLAEMLETGTLVQQQGVWRLRALPGQAQLPAVLPQVLERLVRARVDRLSQAAADAIRAAAVLGTEFTTDVLAETLAVTPGALAPVLEELRASDLVHPEPHDSGGPVFRFRHALIQEATYVALLRAERRHLHARASRAIEAVAGGRRTEVAAILGRHYAIAEIADRALYYLELAGDHATDAFANDEAIASFREALTVAGRAGDEMTVDAVRLHAKLANVLWRTARRDEARVAFRAALRLAGTRPRQLDPVLHAHLHVRLGRLELVEMRYAEAAEAFDAAEAILPGGPGLGQADDAGIDQWLELMIDGRADLHVMRAEYEQALAVLERARPVLDARGAPARRTAFYRIWTMQRLLRNRLRIDDEDVAALHASVAAAEQSGEDRDKDVGYATEFLGWVLWLRGDLSQAADELSKALALAERIGETLLHGKALLWLCLTEMRRHDVQAVRALLSQWYAAGQHKRADLVRCLVVSAWLAWQDGHPEEVIRLTAQIEQRENPVTHVFDAMYRWIYLFPLLAARLQAGELGAAVTAACRIVDPSQQRLPDDLTAVLAAASAAWDGGDHGETTERLRQALDLARAHAYF